MVQLSPKEQALVDSVIQKIKEFDPQAIVQVADDTLEHEDVFIIVYTDKPSLDIIQHIGPYTTDILMNEDLDILVVPEDRSSAQDWGK